MKNTDKYYYIDKNCRIKFNKQYNTYRLQRKQYVLGFIAEWYYPITSSAGIIHPQPSDTIEDIKYILLEMEKRLNKTEPLWKL